MQGIRIVYPNSHLLIGNPWRDVQHTYNSMIDIMICRKYVRNWNGSRSTNADY
jgi:hypothetical protein